MTIINLFDKNKNFEEIKLSPQKTFKFKNSYTTDQNNLFTESLDDSNAIIVNDYPNIGDTSYGLVPLFPWMTKNLKEVNGNTQSSAIYNLKNTSTDEIFSERQLSNIQNASKIRPQLNTLANLEQRNLEIESNYFGIKRLQQNLFPFSEVLNKKKIIRNSLYSSYKIKSDSLYQQQLSYGFYNYNCFNFFNIHPSIKIHEDFKSNFLDNSHKNMLIYSNKSLGNNELTNKISINKEQNALTVNFWINPRRTSTIGKLYNPGCILHIPNTLAIYLVPDSSVVNSNNQPIEFKIYCVFNDDSNKLVYNPTISKSILSNNNLKINTWNNVSVILKKNSIILNINDIETELTYTSVNYTDCPIFTIGNRINNESNIFWNQTNTIQNYYFNNNNYLNFHLNENEISNNQTNINDDINITIFNETDSITYQTQSHALNAELYGLMIFNDDIKISDLNLFANGNENVLDNPFLTFYLPCVYISELVKKKGYITLGKRDDIAYRSCVNPYFAHKIYGHELSIESFVRDIINLRLPYITGMIGNEYQDAFTLNAFDNQNLDDQYILSDKINIIKNFIKDNKNPTQILNQVMTTNLSIIDNNFVKQNQDFQFNNLIYRNNFILPCDNGKSKIDLNNIFNLQTIKTLIGTSISNFYINNNPHLINLENLYESSNQYSYMSGKEFFKNNFVYDNLINNNFLSVSFDRLINVENYVSNVLLSKNSLSNIQTKLFNTIQDKNTKADILNFFQKLKNININKYLIINSIFKNIDENYEASLYIPENQTFAFKQSINYTNYFNSHFTIEGDLAETHSVLFDVSNVLYSSRIRPYTIEIQDVDLSGTGGSLNMKLKDNGKSLMYRADCDGLHATWAHVGHAFYSDGLINVLHPGLSNFGENNFIFNLKGEHSLFLMELDIPIEKSELNTSTNKTYIKGLKPSKNLSDLSVQSFVYITGVNLHDENMNIIAKANFAQPIVKRTNDRYNIRLKMDF